MVAFSKLASAALAIGAASAHTIFQELWVNGVAQGHTVEWHHTLAGRDAGDTADPVDPGHKGPIMAYLAAVPNALQESVTGLKWFKVYEDGWDPATNVWAVDKLYAAKGLVSFKLPDCIPPGNYFLRGELLALHGAGSNLGAQFYMECAQINIVGGGTASPPTVSFPGAYAQNDPGVLVNIYYPPLPSYVIPGPRPFTCGGSNPTTAATTTARTTLTTVATTKAVTTTVATTAKTTTTTTTTAKTTTTTASSGGGTATAWSQCGGSGWTGATVCVSGYKCSAQNAYYSQCIPA
ncbi:hypothetical protein TWF192_003792 [Orbilia oligospora]|nr:hypothetical protein TWF192_003792 [Orbilia oligospora]